MVRRNALMRLLKRLGVLAALGVVLAISSSDIPRRAEASCFYPQRVTTTYYGWYDINGNVICENPFGPSIPPEVVGETIRECDGTTSSWGNTSCSFIGPETVREDCDPICD